MKLRNWFFKIIGLLLLSGVILPSLVVGYSKQPLELDPGNKLQNNTKLGTTSPIDTAALTINFLLGILGTISLCLVVYAGFLWMTSKGNEEDITKAKGILTGTLLGVVVILSSYSFMYFIFRNLVNATF